jgi:hypothetical protein
MNEDKSKRAYQRQEFEHEGKRVVRAFSGDLFYDNRHGVGDGEQGFRKIDQTLQWNDKKNGWEFLYHSFKPFIPEYSDDWFSFRDVYETKDQTISFKPITSHVKGHLVDSIPDVTEQNAVIYDDAFGEGIDLIIHFTRHKLAKLVRIREGFKPSTDISFDFEYKFPSGADVIRAGSIAEFKKGNGYKLDLTKSKSFDTNKKMLIGHDGQGEQNTHLMPFRVWDSGKIDGPLRGQLVEEITAEFIVKAKKTTIRKTITADFLSRSRGDVFTDMMITYRETYDTSYGSSYTKMGAPDDTRLLNGGWSDWYYSYVKPDLAWLSFHGSADIQKAIYYIRNHTAAPAVNPADKLYVVTSTWTEWSVTSTTAPTETATGAVNFPNLITVGVNNWCSMIITALIQNIASGATAYFGFKNHSTSNANTASNFYSSDYSDPAYWPYIEITFKKSIVPLNMAYAIAGQTYMTGDVELRNPVNTFDVSLLPKVRAITESLKYTILPPHSRPDVMSKVNSALFSAVSSATTAWNVTQGNLILVTLYSTDVPSGPPAGLTDNQGNSYTLLSSMAYYASTHYVYGAIMKSGGAPLSLTFNGTWAKVVVAEFHGVSLTTDVATVQSSNNTNPVATNITTSSEQVLLLTMYINGCGGATSLVTSRGIDDQLVAASGLSCVFNYEFVGPGTYTNTITFNPGYNSGNSSTTRIALKPVTLTGLFGNHLSSRYFIAIPTINRYWVGGAGDWDDVVTPHWALTSGGTPNADFIPTSGCDVHIDANSGFGSGGTITIEGEAFMHDLICTSGHTYTIDSTVYVSGSVSLEAGLTIDGGILFESYDTGETISQNGATLTGDCQFSNIGEFTLLTDFVCEGVLQFYGCTFSANGHDVTVGAIDIAIEGGECIINMGSGVWTCNGNFQAIEYSESEATLTLNADTSTLILTGDVEDLFFADYDDPDEGLVFYNVWLKNNCSITNGNHSYHNLKIDPGLTVKFSAGTTHTVESLTAVGTAGNEISIQPISIIGHQIAKANGGSSISRVCSYWYPKITQSFMGTGKAIGKAIFPVAGKAGDPTGDYVAKIYAHSGVYGTSSAPTGDALATSGVITVGAGGWPPSTFAFSGANNIVLDNGVPYVISLEYAGGNIGNYAMYYISLTGADDGNYSQWEGGWHTLATYDLAVTIYDTDYYTFEISKASGNVICDYLILEECVATGGAAFYAGSHSVDNGHNDGWIFDDYSIPTDITRSLQYTVLTPASLTAAMQYEIALASVGVVLNTPLDDATTTDTLPTFNFTGSGGSDIEYNFQLSEDNNFDLRKDLVAYWPLDEESGTRYDATDAHLDLTDPTGVGYEAGKLGNAAKFIAANNQRLVAPYTSLPDGLTYSAWIKLTSANSVAVYDGDAANNIIGNSTGYVYNGWGVHNGKLRYCVYYSGWEFLDGATDVNDGNWHHVAVTHNKDTGDMILYVDRVQDGTMNRPYPPFPDFDTIGGGYGNGGGVGDEFDGDLDEVLAFNRVLPPAEISKLSPAGEVLAYPLASPAIDEYSTVDAGFTAGHPFTPGVAKEYTLQAGDELAPGTYYWRVRAALAAGGDYGDWSEIRTLVVEVVTVFPVDVTKALQYSVTAEQAAISKDFGYDITVKTTTTKGLQYSVTVKHAAITKGAIYDVTAKHAALTKSLQYLVDAKHAALTKGLIYDVTVKRASLTKSAQYVVKAKHSVTKSLVYDVTAKHAALTKGLIYSVVQMLNTLHDDFNDNTFDAAKWTNWGSTAIQETNNQLEASNWVNDTAYHGFDSVYRFCLTGSSLSVEIKNAGNQALASFEFMPLCLSKDATHQLFFLITGGAIKAYKKVNTSTSLASATFSLATHRFLRIRENSGTTYWEYSANGTTWNTLASAASPVATASVTYGMSVGTWANEATQTTAMLDNINVLPLPLTSALKYCVITKAAAKTKSLQYTVTTKHAAITKGMIYDVTVKKAALTKGLIYDITHKQSQTKSLIYGVYVMSTVPHAITKGLIYDVKNKASLSKSLAYSIDVKHSLTKSLAYDVKHPASLTKAMAYGVKAHPSVQKAIQYVVKSHPSISKGFIYDIKHAAAITTGLIYDIKSHPSLSKALKYTLFNAKLLLQKSVQYAVRTTHPTTKALKYTLHQVGALTKALTYRVDVRHAITKALTYSATAKTALSKALKYSVDAKAAVQKSLQYVVRSPQAKSLALKYTLFNRLYITRALKYSVHTYSAITKAFTYRVEVKTAITKALSYHISRPAGITKTLVYKTTHKHAVTKTLVYDITIEGATTKVLTYKVKVNSKLTASLSYHVLLEKTNGKSMRYAIHTVTSHSKQLAYYIETIHAQGLSLSYDITAHDDLHKSLKYTVLAPKTKTLGFAYDIRTIASIIKDFGYQVFRRPIITKSLQYTLHSSVMFGKTLEYVVYPYPYEESNSPYTKKGSSYGKKTSPFTKKHSPFDNKHSPYVSRRKPH